MRSRGQCW